ncbi:Fibrocystin-L [Actinoplanes sp. SE50]|uniref:IPT/TIG domain-containing protein n=1 Tax=unclassified Actinoplanes TaxID=2626549 RepID=UPI00023EC90D|nr:MULTISPECIES: IPT/TIG domain-containing protein [unclassified Actinoplanes]AEV82598.1 Fibrocystin-L [Actinoplanes sp. SE50/110]ATO80994.1 Fibrocystin-L [Actinoplanes sp. SE50]SLL98401.1 Fibrocystin-L [Actinoplanes sp. SE50/110]
MAYSKKSRAVAGAAVAAAVLATGVASQSGAFAAGSTDPVLLGAEFTDRFPAKATGGAVIPVTVTGGTVGATPAAFGALHIAARIGGISAGVAWVDETHLKITAPATGKATNATMQLFRKGAAGPMSGAVVAYYPGVVSVSPSKISSEGGALVTINGNGFLGIDPDTPGAVTFGDVPATAITVVSATRITAVAPEGANGPATVRVKSDGGTSEVSGGGKVNYRGALSVDTTDDPTAKASGGPLLLKIKGGTVGASAKEFTAERIVVRLDRKALTATWVDESHVKVVMPPRLTDTATLTVTHDDIPGDEATVSIAPVVTNLSAKTDTLAGGTKVLVRVAGADAGNATSFSFGDHPADCAKQGSGSSLSFQCTVPAATDPGPVPITFTSGTGKQSHFTAASVFNYTDN